MGYELVLPGVHSNIGGSYGEVTDEEERLLHAQQCVELVAQGWYRAEEITREGHKVVGRRRGLTWEYQFIPLALMVGCANKFMSLESLRPGSRFAKYALSADHPLIPVQAAIQAQVASHGDQGRHELQLPQGPVLPFETAPLPALTTLALMKH